MTMMHILSTTAQDRRQCLEDVAQRLGRTELCAGQMCHYEVWLPRRATLQLLQTALAD